MPNTLQWTQQEDDRLRELVEEHGTKAWAKIAGLLRTKGSKQCRRRWKNFLNMSAKQCSWSPEEDATLVDAHRRLGNRWTEISKIFGDRTDNAVKNRWHALIRKNPELDRQSGDSSEGAGAPRAKRRRTTRGAAASGTTDADSDLLDSARHRGGLSRGGGGSGALSGANTSGGISAAAMPTPFDALLAGGAAGGNPMALHQQQQQQQQAAAQYATAAAAAALRQQQQAAYAAALAAQQGLVPQQAQQQQGQQLGWEQWAPSVQYVGQYFLNPPQQQQAGQPAPLQIMVTKDFLTPWEQQLADEINAMNVPVHVEVAPVALPPDASLLPGVADSLLPAQEPSLAVQRSSWKQFLERMDRVDEPGDSRGLQELLEWFGNTNSQLPASGASNELLGNPLGSRRLTRSLSKSSSGGSGSLATDHRQLLVKLMSRGLEARSSSEEAMAAAAAAVAAAAAAPPGAPRFDPLKRTRSSQGGPGRQGSDLTARAAAAAVQQSGLAAAAAAGYTLGSGGFNLPASLGSGGANGGVAAALGASPGRASRGAGAAGANGSLGGGGSLSMPLIEPNPLGLSKSDVLVTPTFSSQEIAMLLDALKK